MTDRQPPENHPFAEFFREQPPVAAKTMPSPRRERERERARQSTRQQLSPKKPRRRRVIGIIVTVVVLGLIVGGGAYVYNTFATQITAMLAGSKTETADYSGNGSGEVMFKINDGDFGEAIGENLESAGVVKSSDTFYDLLLKQSPQPVFQTGTFKLAKKMSSQAALDALLDPKKKVDFKVTVTEGSAAAGIYQSLADATGIALADFQAAGANFAALGVPATAPSIEGYLFPATYDFQPGQNATDILKEMVDRTFQSLDALAVAPDDRFRVLTMAALVQKEAGSVEDMGKVARVFQNRLDDGMNLQSDATVAYGAGVKTVETTEAEREDASNLYNTYANPGLPIGPISNPGDDAIKAALTPTEGPWIYFVTVNLDTGETVFSVTEDEHEQAVEQLQQWWADHPEVK